MLFAHAVCRSPGESGSFLCSTRSCADDGLDNGIFFALRARFWLRLWEDWEVLLSTFILEKSLILPRLDCVGTIEKTDTRSRFISRDATWSRGGNGGLLVKGLCGFEADFAVRRVDIRDMEGGFSFLESECCSFEVHVEQF